MHRLAVPALNVFGLERERERERERDRERERERETEREREAPNCNMLANGSGHILGPDITLHAQATSNRLGRDLKSLETRN